jgi:hypothetical protein
MSFWRPRAMPRQNSPYTVTSGERGRRGKSVPEVMFDPKSSEESTAPEVLGPCGRLRTMAPASVRWATMQV